jgi:hypothetical protein
VRPGSPAAAKGTSPIDAFLDAEMTKHGLTANPEADPERLLRRVTLDLTGHAAHAGGGGRLPERHRSRRLRTLWSIACSARLATANRSARGWLDAARYADTHGLHLDNERQMWPYRDWVVERLQPEPAVRPVHH